MSAYGADPVDVVVREVEVVRIREVPTAELGGYMQQRINALEAERDYYRVSANGLKGTSLLLQTALRKLNPKVPELSREFLDKAYDEAVDRNALDDKKVQVIASSPTLAEMGLDKDGKPKAPIAPGEPGGGFLGKLGKLLGG